MRGHRPVEFFRGEERTILEALRKELFDLCEKYEIEKPPFLVTIMKVRRHGGIRYRRFDRFCQVISISSEHLSTVYFKELMNTIRHEFGHLWTLKKYGFVDHGHIWKSFVKTIGGDGKRSTVYLPDKKPYVIDLPVPFELPKNYQPVYQVAAEKAEPRFIYECKCGREFKRFKKISESGSNKGFCPSCHTYLFQMKLTELE